MRTYYPTIRVKLDDGAFLLDRAHETDAGADIFAPHDVTVPRSEVNDDGGVDVGCAIVHTGVHVELGETTAGMVKSKSGLNVKHGIISEGVVDEGYDGEIVVKLYNLTSKPVFGRHPHVGARAYIHFYDRHHRPCPEEDSFCGVYAEYDGNGTCSAFSSPSSME